jgi:hypothetical protein
MDPHFMNMLDSLRKAVGEPLIILSGYRCDFWDHQPPAKGDGNHPTGRAVDLECEHSTLRFKIIFYAITLGFKRIGLARGFIHLDMTETVTDHPGLVLWVY